MRKPAVARQNVILSVLSAFDRPMTASRILDRLQLGEPDIAPPTEYRILSALSEQGRANRLESIKVFLPRRCSHVEIVPVLAICEDCKAVEEHDGSEILPKLTALADQSAFRPDRHIVEIHGQCGTWAA